MSRHRIVIGRPALAGLTAARRPKKADADITSWLARRTTLPAPLCQVATGISPRRHAPTTREILQRQKNVTVRRLSSRKSTSRRVIKGATTTSMSRPSTTHADRRRGRRATSATITSQCSHPGMKTIDDALRAARTAGVRAGRD